jgi:hypothetical protein
MSLFNINISKLIRDLLPPEKRVVNIIALCKGLFSKQDNDNLNTLETIEGSTAPQYATGTYSQFDRVIFQSEVYESLKDSNTDLPTVATSWAKVVNNFLGTNETQKYTTSAIHVEYALNRYFENMASTPYELSTGAIYFSNAQLPALSFLIGYTETNSSAVGYLGSNYYITYDESIIPNYTVLEINVPTATATALGANYEQIIRNFADKYISQAIVYIIQLY